MGLHFVSMKNKHPALGIYKLGYLLSMIYLREKIMQGIPTYHSELVYPRMLHCFDLLA